MTYSYHETVERGEVINKEGYHKPDNYGPFTRPRGCGCDKTTPKGAYRDVSVRLKDGTIVHFYHQSPVVVEQPDGNYQISSCGYHTSTTKERINRYIPSQFFIRQRDFEWYVEKDGETVKDFKDRMVLEI